MPFWFRLAWGLRASVQLTGSFSQLAGASVSGDSPEGVAQMRSIALAEERKVLDFGSWLNYCSVALFGFFPFFLHLLTSLIEFPLGNLRET